MASSHDHSEQPKFAKQGLYAEPNPMENSISPRTSATKVVSIAEPESISPVMKGKPIENEQGFESFDLDRVPKQHRASVSGKRLQGRPSFERSGSSVKQSLAAASLSSLLSDDVESPGSRPQSRHSQESLVHQVAAWLKQEKARRKARRAKRKAARGPSEQDTRGQNARASGRERSHSESSESSVALDHLASIIEKNLSFVSNESSSIRRKVSSSRRLSAIMKRHSTAASSDTDFYDGEPVVPSCAAVLDNSKTLAYSGGEADSGETVDGQAKSGKSSPKEKEAWATFKFEIVRLTHTLGLKGWRKVTLEGSSDIVVERLSGALTNAVYVVAPPKELPPKQGEVGGPPVPRNPPPKLLLRIYGPQVEHLIDREAELQILQRLARKRIGPRLLGTFSNGRFEEFFHATTLTAKDLRVPDTSKQIAKRMRELHEGIDLLSKEREDGPFVWRNWDKWVDRCEQIVNWLDGQVIASIQWSSKSKGDVWKQRGFVCGVEWSKFRQTVEKYRQWLEDQYGGADKVNDRLVFAHNDTQYGNILRLIPAGESPLLLPANEHKQLVVIDFEYANANLPGLEFANHFTEWCYNYHDPVACHACTTKNYPTPEEQYRFVRSYLTHQPTFRGVSASNPSTPFLGPATPSLRPLSSAGNIASTATATPSSSISTFMLDSRGPPSAGLNYEQQEEKVEQETEEEIQRLMAETRLWRLANSAQWVAWGIVQAHVPGMPEFKTPKRSQSTAIVNDEGMSKQARDLESALLEVKKQSEQEEVGPGVTEAEEEKQEEEEFDYLAYAQDRAFFFWGDALRLGIVKMEDLPEEIRGKVKLVEY